MSLHPRYWKPTRLAEPQGTFEQWVKDVVWKVAKMGNNDRTLDPSKHRSALKILYEQGLSYTEAAKRLWADTEETRMAAIVKGKEVTTVRGDLLDEQTIDEYGLRH